MAYLSSQLTLRLHGATGYASLPYVGYFGVVDYSQILLNLSEGARRRLAGTLRRLRKNQLRPPALPERPT